MKWSDVPFQPTSKALRQFAAGCLVFFTGMGAVQYFMQGRHAVGGTMMAAGLLLGVAGLIKPRSVKPIFVGWMVLAFPIGWVVSQCMMVLMFYVVLTPVALLLKLKRRDQLGLKRDAGSDSLWVPAEPPKDVRSYFRQY